LSASPKVLIVAGETSGDLHAAPVVAAMKAKRRDLQFFGAGGSLMQKEGVELLAEVNDLAVMGFTGIPKILPKLARLKRQILTRVNEDQISLAILTDYPGFNLNLARSLKALPNPPQILFYVAPQLWAWRTGRVKYLQRYVDQLAVVFAFEVEFFRKFDIEAHFVGHPLLEEIDPYLKRANRTQTISPLLALLPGSRLSVAAKHLPIMLEASRELKKSIPNLRVGIGQAETLRNWDSWKNVERDGFTIWQDARELLVSADAAAVCSGTATLETALLGVPQVVVYKTSTLNYQIAKTFVQIPNVALANVIVGRTIVPELLQDDFTAESLAGELKKILFDDDVRSQMKAGYQEVVAALGTTGAAKRVAEIALAMIKQ